jgi:hypothetical protein
MDLLVFLYNYTQFWHIIINEYLRFAPFLTGPKRLPFYYDEWRIPVHTLNCLRRCLSLEKNTNSLRSSDCFWLLLTDGLSWVLSLMLWPTVSWWVCLGIKHPSGAYDKIFITVRQLRVYLCGTFSLTRGRVCRLQLLLVLASAEILGSESHGTHDHSLLSQIQDFHFRRLLRLAGLRWRYSTPPPYGVGWLTVSQRAGGRAEQSRTEQ